MAACAAMPGQSPAPDQAIVCRRKVHHYLTMAVHALWQSLADPCSSIFRTLWAPDDLGNLPANPVLSENRSFCLGRPCSPTDMCCPPKLQPVVIKTSCTRLSFTCLIRVTKRSLQ